MKYTYEEAKPYLRLRGRTAEDPVNGGLYINWSTAGAELRMKGTRLSVQVEATGNKNLMDPAAPEEFPCLALIDEEDRILLRTTVKPEDREVTLWESEEPQECILKIIKMSENSRGKLRLGALDIEGELLPLPEKEKKPLIEVVGDSITCGYGNEAPGPEEHFVPEHENGWETYGARAARAIGADWSLVSTSGIAVSGWAGAPAGFGPPHFAMEEQYAYTDRHLADLKGLPNPEWDFKAHPSDVVVINLGTNDASQIAFSRDQKAAEDRFREHYGAFIRGVRRLNGPDTHIVCALGTMDYYLYDVIRDCVTEYKEESGDPKISCFKFGHTNMMLEGFGGDMHPSLKTHERMGRELAAYLSGILLQK